MRRRSKKKGGVFSNSTRTKRERERRQVIRVGRENGESEKQTYKLLVS